MNEQERMQRNFYNTELAESWLASARELDNSIGCIRMVRKELRRGSFTLADIGTSEEDLALVVKSYCKQRAEEVLVAIRKLGSGDGLLECLREHLTTGELTLTDIGTSEKKLEKLSKKSA